MKINDRRTDDWNFQQYREKGLTDVTYRKRDETFDVELNAATCWGLCNATGNDGTKKRGMGQSVRKVREASASNAIALGNELLNDMMEMAVPACIRNSPTGYRPITVVLFIFPAPNAKFT